MTDPLTDDQRQRAAVLYATQEALHVELDSFDLIRCAHWVATGEELAGQAAGEFVGGADMPDAARWKPSEPRDESCESA